jgi:hypothetical protein
MSVAGYPSILAPWVGGAQSPPPSVAPLCGFPSMMALWLGGAQCAGTITAGRSPAWRRIASQRTLSAKRKDEEEAILLLYS